MPLGDDSLTAQFAGEAVAQEKLKALGWVDQGGSKPRGFLPKRKGLWSMEFEPAFDSCEPIKLYVLLNLDDEAKVAKVETVVARVMRNGRRDEMYLPIRYPDDETAKNFLRAALTDAARAELEAKTKRAASVAVCVPGLVRLIGRPDQCGEAQLIADRFALRKSATLFGEGTSWTCRGSRLEFQTDARGRITTVFLTTGRDDMLTKDVPATSSRDAVRLAFGPPTRSADDGGWDRFDGKLALHVSYTSDKASTTKITVMARHVAP